MRIPDEVQKFQIGESVIVTDQSLASEQHTFGTVESVLASSVYYEARPIASFTEYTYVIRIAEQRHYLKANQISSVVENQQ